MSEHERAPVRLPGAGPLDELARRVRSLVEAGPARDVQRNLQAALSGALQRMDLVTREEFDAQAALLAPPRERLEALQARVDALERALSVEPVGSAPAAAPVVRAATPAPSNAVR
jgi:BMFP domain-containing protein YqiC